MPRPSAAIAASVGASWMEVKALETARIGVICGDSACREVKQAQVP
jgi:hypothetical protein